MDGTHAQLVFDLDLHSLDGIGWFDLHRKRAPAQGVDKDLHILQTAECEMEEDGAEKRHVR